MLQAMYNGVSAIIATQQDMDVIGNNIANVNTTAYKSSRASFADQLSQTIQGASSATATIGGLNPRQTGTGTKIGSIDTLNTQGGLLSTGAPTDLAIQGNGYFMVSSPATGISYTRDGHFAVDNQGNVVNGTTGEFVLGWQADNTGKIDTTQTIGTNSTLKVAVGGATAVKATSAISYNGNLSADTAAGGTYSRDVKVFDSLGEPHTITLTFTRQSTLGVANNTWNWTASGDPGITTPTGTVNQGSVTFNSAGALASQTGTLNLTTADGSGTPQPMTVDFSAVQQLTGANTLGPKSQDGYTAGSLQSFTIDSHGIISGIFSNGSTRPLGQIAMAGFTNPGGLNKIGNNEYSVSANSGEPTVGQASTAGLGAVATGYLEQSNVDLGTEFTNMIVVQRAFQANTKIVTTVDQMLNELVQMKQ